VGVCNLVAAAEPRNQVAAFWGSRTARNLVSPLRVENQVRGCGCGVSGLGGRVQERHDRLAAGAQDLDD